MPRIVRTPLSTEHRYYRAYYLNHHHSKLTKMKNYTTLVAAILLLCFMFHSCKKEAIQEVPKFENLRNLPDAAEKRIAFNGLTSIEKADFWKYNLKNYMNSLTPMQKNLVMDIYKKLSPTVYEKGTADYITFTTLIIPGWLKKAEAIFSKDKISELFYSMEGEKVVNSTANSYALEQVPQEAVTYYSESAPDCICNIGSSYSCKKKAIEVGTGGVKMTVSYGSCNYSTRSSICDRDDYGCGFSGLWACNGNTCTY